MNHQVTIRPRSLANLLADLKEARRDYDDALGELSSSACGPFYDGEIADRTTEAETRLDDLRTEFQTLFAETTGLAFDALMRAREEAVL